MAEDPQILLNIGTPKAQECLIGIQMDGLLHMTRLAICLNPFLKEKEITKKPFLDLKVMFNNHRGLFEHYFQNVPERKRQCKELCDKLDEMFFPQWEAMCEKNGWTFEQVGWGRETKKAETTSTTGSNER